MKKLIVVVLALLVMCAGVIVWRHIDSRNDIKQAARSSTAAVQNEILQNAERLVSLLKKCRQTAQKHEQAKKTQNQ